MPSTMKTMAPCVQTGRQHPIHMPIVSPFFLFLLTVYLPAHTARTHHLLRPTTHRPLPAIRTTVMLWGVVAPALAAQWLAATATRTCRFPAARWPPHCAHPLCCAVRRQWPPPASSVLTPMRQHWEVSMFIYLHSFSLTHQHGHRPTCPHHQ